MTEELSERFDKWLNDLEEDLLKRFLVSGIMAILCLGVVGILVSKPYAYNAVWLLTEVGFLPNGIIPVFVVDIIRFIVAFLLCFWIMLLFLECLETTFLRLR